MSSIFAPVQTAKLINPDGTASPQMLLYLNQIQNRVGGVTGGKYSPLTSTGGNILWDLDSAPIAVVRLDNGVNILTALNQVAGFLYPYRITLIQPAAGAAGTIAWPANFLFPGGVTPVLSVANNAIDMLFYVSDGTSMYLTVEGLSYAP